MDIDLAALLDGGEDPGVVLTGRGTARADSSAGKPRRAPNQVWSAAATFYAENISDANALGMEYVARESRAIAPHLDEDEANFTPTRKIYHDKAKMVRLTSKCETLVTELKCPFKCGYGCKFMYKLTTAPPDPSQQGGSRAVCRVEYNNTTHSHDEADYGGKVLSITMKSKICGILASSGTERWARKVVLAMLRADESVVSVSEGKSVISDYITKKMDKPRGQIDNYLKAQKAKRALDFGGNDYDDLINFCAENSYDIMKQVPKFNKNTVFVVAYEVDKEREIVRIKFSTEKFMNRLAESQDVLPWGGFYCCDATYKMNANKFPLAPEGTVDMNNTFHFGCINVISCETKETYGWLIKATVDFIRTHINADYMKSKKGELHVTMADHDLAIQNSMVEVFGQAVLNGRCFPHMARNYNKRVRTEKGLDLAAAKEYWVYIRNIRTMHMENHDLAMFMLHEFLPYSFKDNDEMMKIHESMKKVYYLPHQIGWMMSKIPAGAKTHNQHIEGKNSAMKTLLTCRRRQSLALCIGSIKRYLGDESFYDHGMAEEPVILPSTWQKAHDLIGKGFDKYCSFVGSGTKKKWRVPSTGTLNHLSEIAGKSAKDATWTDYKQAYYEVTRYMYDEKDTKRLAMNTATDATGAVSMDWDVKFNKDIDYETEEAQQDYQSVYEIAFLDETRATQFGKVECTCPFYQAHLNCKHSLAFSK